MFKLKLKCAAREMYSLSNVSRRQYTADCQAASLIIIYSKLLMLFFCKEVNDLRDSQE